MSVTHPDSVEKVVKYFQVVAKVPFTSGNLTYHPRPLMVSAHLARGYECPTGCGACCPVFSLDYLPSEDKPEGVRERVFEFNRRKILVYTDFQSGNPSKHCRHLSKDARCAIHPVRPFSCDFELIRTYLGPKLPASRIAVARFGRDWNLTRADGGKGTLCEILPRSDESIRDTVRKLRRLEAWASHFGLTETWIPEVIDFLEVTKGSKGNITLVP
jgi:hypothetical protein